MSARGGAGSVLAGPRRRHSAHRRGDSRARPVGLPGAAPLGLEVGLVAGPDCGVLPGRELAEGALADMMNIGVLGAGHAIAGLPHANREIVVLEEPDAERLVERPDRA